jgi:hypothetical protein
MPTPQEIAQDQYLSSETKEKLNGFLTRVAKDDPIKVNDAQNKMALYSGIQNGAITSEKPIWDAYFAQKIGDPSRKELIAEFNNTDKAEMSDQKARALAIGKSYAYGPSAVTEEERATDAQAAVQQGRESADQRLQRFQQNMDAKIKQYKSTEGKNWHDLFDPTKTQDYLLSNDAMKPFMPPLKEKLTKGTSANPVAPPGPIDLTTLDEQRLKAYATWSPENYDAAVKELARRGRVTAPTTAPIAVAPAKAQSKEPTAEFQP